MSYCTSSDVQALNPRRTYDSNSTPTLTQVDGYITQIAGEIDTVLQGRAFTTPVATPTEFVTWLKQLNALGAAALAERAMFPEAQGMLGGTAASAQHWKQYQDGLHFLRTGNLPTGTTGENLPFSFFEQQMGSDTEPKETYDWQKPKFGKNKEF